MLGKSGMRFNRIDDDEGLRQKRKYEENLKQKKEQLKQEFDQLEEIRKMDELSVKSLNLVKFKNEFDRVSNINKQKKSNFNQLQKLLDGLEQKSNSDSQQFSSSQMKFSRSNINNHHSDMLFSTFSKNLTSRNLQLEDLQPYNQELQEQEDRYDQLVQEEEEGTQSLELILEQTMKQKLYLTKEIEEMKLLNRIANTRFSNIETINFLAVEKNTQSRKNLKEIKAELDEMDNIRIDYRKAQNQKQGECQKEIVVGEEYVSHNSMKIEEATLKNRDLEQQIELLKLEEKKILKKRQKSRYIMKYIECFEKFEKIFMNPNEQSDGDRLVDKYHVHEEQLLQEVNSDKVAEVTVDYDEDSENISNDELDRNQLLNVINNFFQDDETRAEIIVEFMIAKFWQLRTDVNKNNLTYETLLREKTKFQHRLDILQNDLEELIFKNDYLQQNDDDKELKKSEEVKQLEQVVDSSNTVSVDTGLFVSNINNKGTVTLNIVMQEISSSDDTLLTKTKQAQNLLFNFLLSCSELMERSFKILKLIKINSTNMASLDIDQQVSTIESFIQSLWQKRNRPRGASKRLTGSKVIQNNQKEIHDESSSEIHLNFHQIYQTFREVFLEETEQNRKASTSSKDQIDSVIHEASKYFYVQCKQDQLMWFFLDISNLRDFLLFLRQENKDYFRQPNRSKLTVNILIPAYQIAVLRQQLVGVFSSLFEQLLQFYRNLQVKLKDLSGELKIYLKEKDPKFDSGRLQFLPVKEGKEIKEAREKISKKMELYHTGELIAKKNSESAPGLNKIFSAPKELTEGQDKLLLRGLVKIVEPQLNAQQELFLVEENNKDTEISEEQLQHIKSFFRGKLHQKYEPHIALKKQQEEMKENKKKSQISEKDEFEEERDKIKDDMFEQWEQVQEAKTEKVKIPQALEQITEKKNQIKEATERLYGDRDQTAQTLKTMSLTTGILSDIDRLEKQPSPIEQPFLISNFKLQKKSMGRNLNSEVTLPTLDFLKPTSAYISRRQQSQEQRRVMQQKKYDLIESGMAPSSTSNMQRPQTEQLHFQKPKLISQEGQRGKKPQPNFNVEKYYARYGNQANSEKFLGYLMRQKSESPGGKGASHQQGQFAFPRNGDTRIGTSQGGTRPKSILVQPNY